MKNELLKSLYVESIKNSLRSTTDLVGYENDTNFELQFGRLENNLALLAKYKELLVDLENVNNELSYYPEDVQRKAQEMLTWWSMNLASLNRVMENVFRSNLLKVQHAEVGQLEDARFDEYNPKSPDYVEPEKLAEMLLNK